MGTDKLGNLCRKSNYRHGSYLGIQGNHGHHKISDNVSNHGNLGNNCYNSKQKLLTLVRKGSYDNVSSQSSHKCTEVKLLLYLSDFNQTWMSSTSFNKIFSIIKCYSLGPVVSYGQPHSQTNTTKLIAAFPKRDKAPNKKNKQNGTSATVYKIYY